MSSITLEYPVAHRSVEMFRRAQPVESGPQPLGPVVYSGLSPFDVPGRIVVTLDDNDRCSFQFHYANAEPEEPNARVGSIDGRVTVKLGQHTRKILRVMVANATAELEGDAVHLEPLLVARWTTGLPAHAYSTAVKNAELVHALLRAMPHGFREALVRSLRSILAEQATTRQMFADRLTADDIRTLRAAAVRLAASPSAPEREMSTRIDGLIAAANDGPALRVLAAAMRDVSRTLLDHQMMHAFAIIDALGDAAKRLDEDPPLTRR